MNSRADLPESGSLIHSEDLREEQVRQIDGLMPMSVVGTVISSVVLSFVLRNQVAPVVLLTWLAFLLVLTVCRHPLVYRRVGMVYGHGTRRLENFFVVGATLSGMVWGATSIFLFPPESLAHQVFLAFVLGGMVAGAVGLYSVLFKVFCVFSIPAVSPLIIRFFWTGDEIHLGMATMSFFFMAIMFSTAKRINGTAINNIHLSLKNKELITSLSTAKERAEKVNKELTRYRDRLQETVEERTRELMQANEKLQDIIAEQNRTQAQLLQQEKMASIGLLAAGVAHEINNPIGFVSSNIRALNKYVARLLEFIDVQAEVLSSLQALDRVAERRQQLKLDYIVGDVGNLIDESLDGTERMKKIVQNLKSFSRLDEAKEEKLTDINECLETTLDIVWNELKYKTTVHKEYGDLPLTRCFPQQLDQVFMNLLVNAAQAIDRQGEITIKTWHANDEIKISIGDTGCGIPEDKLNKIFDPFFTTKEVGHGTGLGLSITYDIVKKHNGEITVDSEEGKGSVFTITLPVSGDGKEEQTAPSMIAT